MKEFKIQIPEGYEIDKEKSTFEKIVFKKKFSDYTTIKTFQDAVCFLLRNNPDDKKLITSAIDFAEQIKCISPSIWALTRLNIIKKALNYGHDLENLKEYFTPNIDIEKEEYDDDICKIQTIQGKYYVRNAYRQYSNIPYHGSLDLALLICATEDIATHFGTYFYKLILTAAFGDFKNFKIIDCD